LKLPRSLRRGRPTNDQAHALCAAAREAIAARAEGDRRYLARFEAALAEAFGGRREPQAPAGAPRMRLPRGSQA